MRMTIVWWCWLWNFAVLWSTVNGIAKYDSSLEAIVSYQGNYSSAEEEGICERMVNSLTPSEQQLAASTSYAYWLSHQDEATRIRMAKREARRHLVAEDGDFDRAMERLREACKLRAELKLDDLRYLFGEDEGAVKDEYILQQRGLIEKELSRQLTWVTEHDSGGMAVLHRSSRQDATVDAEAFELLLFYATEKAIATTEMLSRGRNEQITVMMYFQDYRQSLAPPIEVVQKSLQKLQIMYPERVARVMILDPPFWLRLPYMLVSPFLSESTKQKVKFISKNEIEKQALNRKADLYTASASLFEPHASSMNQDVIHMTLK